MLMRDIRPPARKALMATRAKTAEYYRWFHGFLTGTKLGLPISGVLLFLVAALVVSAIAEPERVTFVPIETGGGWENSVHAGVLSLGELAEIQEFSEKNSAYVFFEPPPEPEEEDEEETEAEPESVEGSESAATTTSPEPETATTSEETPAESPDDETETATSTPPDSGENSTNSEPLLTDPDGGEPTEEPEPEEAPAETPAEEEPQSEEPAPTSFLRNVLRATASRFLGLIARAQEESASPPPPPAPTLPPPPPPPAEPPPPPEEQGSPAPASEATPAQNQKEAAEEVILPTIDGEIVEEVPAEEQPQTEAGAPTSTDAKQPDTEGAPATESATTSEERVIILPDIDGNIPQESPEGGGGSGGASGESPDKTQKETDGQTSSQTETARQKIYTIKKELVVSGFAEVSTGSEQTNTLLKDVELFMSLAMERDADSDDVLIVDFRAGSSTSWSQLTSLTRDRDHSNGTNGGYFQFSVPFRELRLPFDPQTFEVRLTALSNNDGALGPAPIFVDAVWMEISYENEEVLEEVSDKRVFQSFETPEFVFRHPPEEGIIDRIANNVTAGAEEHAGGEKEKPKKFRVNSIRAKHEIGSDERVLPKVELRENREMVVRVERDEQHFRPGEYTVTLDVQRGDEYYKQTITFYWGVLSVNFNKSIYADDEIAYIQMGALTNVGNTICNANLRLTVVSPNGIAAHPNVFRSGECSGNNVTENPDYFAYYTTKGLGTYEVTLERLDEFGAPIHSVTDVFGARESVPFDVERIGPTRIYPPAIYRMRILIRANERFDGDIIEFVPPDFEVFGSGFTVGEREDPHSPGKRRKALVWNRVLEAGDSFELTYEFDAPDISPELFLLGPLTFETYVPRPGTEPAPPETTEESTAEDPIPIIEITPTTTPEETPPAPPVEPPAPPEEAESGASPTGTDEGVESTSTAEEESP